MFKGNYARAFVGGGIRFIRLQRIMKKFESSLSFRLMDRR